ncbi:ATP-binding protein [uncultured Helicobacter sp.]|uniref:AAA family ATPase n=1 Tax=uncultured Helicobacter sp. TaxID=175537 RepID=UPI002602ADA0|nr:ATP-binding protein [uncultured Helicobacter sp.]
MVAQAKRDNKVLSKYRIRQRRALKQAESSLLEPSKQSLAKLLPFNKPIANDKDYEKKFFVAHLMDLFPHLMDLDSCFRLFRKHFSVSLTDFDDEAMVAEFITPYLLEHFHALRPKPFVRKNLALLQECFGLSALEVQIIYAFYIYSKVSSYCNCLSDDKLDYYEVCSLIGEVLQVSHTKVAKLLMADMPLRQLGLLDTGYADGRLELESFAQSLMQEPLSRSEFVGSVARAMPASTLECHDFSYMQKDLDMLLDYCKNAKNPSIFLYGKPGVGKNEIAALLAKELNRELWEIHNLKNGKVEDKRYEQFVRAQAMLDKDRAMILLDECEDIFPTLYALFFENKPSKNTLNKMLESVKLPSIFLSNSANIDPAFLRRFDIVLEIHAPPQEKKQEILQKALQSQGIKVDSRIMRQMSESSLSQGVLLQACKVAKTLAKNRATQSPKERQKGITDSLIQVLNEHLKLQGQPTIATKAPQALPYNMSLINASVDMQSLCEKIKNVCGAKDSNKLESSLDSSDSAQGIRILAYGMAGSGKSEFAKALAKELNKPIMLKRASDLLSMWLGGSEKNIAAAFREAEKRGAILVLDEVDSFLQDRSGAQRSWEVSQVNEMLTQMENFEGIFIATTNFMDTLDRASIRRFDMKVEFKPLDCARLKQAFSLYAKHLGISDYAVFLESTSAKRALEKLENICFGDFALIARGAAFAPLESAQELLEKLQEEARLKGLSAAGSSKRVGF